MISTMRDTINDLYNSAPHLFTHVESIVCGGSQCLPYIKNNRDVDLFVYFPNNYYPFNKRTLAQKVEVDAIVLAIKTRLIDKFHLLSITVCSRPIRRLTQITDINEWHLSRDCFIDLYQNPYVIVLYKNIDTKINRDDAPKFFSTMDKQIYIESIRWLMQERPNKFNDNINPQHRTKYLYHILVGLYSLKNNSLTQFTEEQIKNINIAHDCTDGYEELWKWAKRELKNKLAEYK